MAKACAHDGFHSVVARYDREGARLTFLWTCDACGSVVSELGTLRYRPRPALPDRGRTRARHALSAQMWS